MVDTVPRSNRWLVQWVLEVRGDDRQAVGQNSAGEEE